MAVTMELGGLDLSPNFPIYGRTFDIIRPDDQGPSFKKVIITLSGFLEGTNHKDVMDLFDILKVNVDMNDTTFTFQDGSSTYYNDKPVYVQAYNEPQDTEYAKYGVGDYSIELYYFEDSDQSLGIICTYGPYTFEKPPTWSRSVVHNRDSHRAPMYGSTISIRLNGFLFATSHAALLAKVNALQTAFLTDQILTYGGFQQAVRVGPNNIAPAVLKNYAFFDIELLYDLGSIVSFKKEIDFSRLHDNPVITEEPFCDRRVIELMNPSAQEIGYSFTIEAADITQARLFLIGEVANVVQPGGIELPGGREVWDYSAGRISLSFRKFHDTPVLQNLLGT